MVQAYWSGKFISYIQSIYPLYLQHHYVYNIILNTIINSTYANKDISYTKLFVTLVVVSMEYLSDTGYTTRTFS